MRVLVFPCGLKLLGKLILVFNNFFCHRFDCIQNGGFNGRGLDKMGCAGDVHITVFAALP